MLISSELLDNYAVRLKNSPSFTQSIVTHCALMYELYQTQPAFYKLLLRESRFNIVLAVSCFVFGNQATSLSNVKHLCAQYKISSPNSIIAILTFLRASGRLHLNRDDADRRKITISPTARGLDELKMVIRCVFEPLALLCPSPRIDVARMDDPDFRHDFYYRAAESLFRGLTFDSVFPAITPFIDKDAGRILILRLYQLAHANGLARQTVIKNYQNRLAKELAVSRTHIRRIILMGCQEGYFEEAAAGSLALTPAFFKLVERYAALYFSWALYFVNVEP